MIYVREYYEKAIELLSQDKINIDLLISKYFDMREFEQAYRFIDECPSNVMKVMLKVGDKEL